MKSQQSDTKTTKQVRIDKGLHKLLKIESARRGESIKSLIEGCLMDLLEIKGEYQWKLYNYDNISREDLLSE